MSNLYFDKIALISIFSVLIPLAFYFGRFKEQARQNHIIGALLIVSACIDALMWFLYKEQKSTLVFNNFYVIVSFLLITAFYYELVFKKRARYAFVFCLIVFVIAWVQTGITSGIQ